jgi:hypothetical protein
MLYCRVGKNKTPDVSASLARRDRAGSSKIKILASSCCKAHLALLHDEVRILIFDDPPEQDTSRRKRLVMVRSGRGPVKHARTRHARAMHNFFPRKFTTSRARAPCGRYVPVSYRSTRQYIITMAPLIRLIHVQNTVNLRRTELQTLRPLVLGGIIENQNSDFVMQ